jgi:hypothetical protein
MSRLEDCIFGTETLTRAALQRLDSHAESVVGKALVEAMKGISKCCARCGATSCRGGGMRR